MNIWLISLRIRAHQSWKTGKHLNVLHVLRTLLHVLVSRILGYHNFCSPDSKLFLAKKSFGMQLMFWCWIEESWWCCNAGEKRRKRRWCSTSTPGQRRKDVLSYLSSRFATFSSLKDHIEVEKKSLQDINPAGNGGEGGQTRTGDPLWLLWQKWKVSIWYLLGFRT